MELSQYISLETKQILSQSQIQSLEILALDGPELEEFLQNEYMNNPLMEYQPNQNGQDHVEENIQWFESGNMNRKKRNDDEDEYDARNHLVAPDTDYLKNYILNQVDYHSLSEKEWELAKWLIDCLEDDGFFRMSTEEVASLVGVPESMVKKVLSLLQDLEPYGIFAPDLSACLLKQLESMGEEDENLKNVIKNYLMEISEGKISVISRETGLSTAQIRGYIARISRLNPRPLSGLQQAEVTFIVPDIIYTWNNGEWSITVNERHFGDYRINEDYLHLMKNVQDKELAGYFKKNLDRCKFILNSVEQRKETMASIARIVLQKQKSYFSGQGKLQPMTMTSVAGELGVHPSTISRAVRGKYIKSPAGTILMKELFQGSVTCNQSGEVSAESIKERLRELIAQEDKRKPYSDAKLVELLKEEEIHISRRAVAKYRDELWIKSSFDRKIR